MVSDSPASVIVISSDSDEDQDRGAAKNWDKGHTMKIDSPGSDTSSDRCRGNLYSVLLVYVYADKW